MTEVSLLLISYLPSVHNLVHSQEETLHILQQRPPLNIFPTEKNENML